MKNLCFIFSVCHLLHFSHVCIYSIDHNSQLSILYLKGFRERSFIIIFINLIISFRQSFMINLHRSYIYICHIYILLKHKLYFQLIFISHVRSSFLCFFLCVCVCVFLCVILTKENI